ncbi:amidohydrolase family protein [Psychroserpens ponticola]|uniref:Amidohydrolase-related domain-containing protein n=1 Tax=Psychroserpens ponticola TaxID=2932268 RepID=A0ABY7S054_9FLAO|nr:hypothetical protein [Psychroserpens ponticola]WCO02316.1 hypothetical protein MUN68_002225 [Psychroserpens ponticola]
MSKKKITNAHTHVFTSHFVPPFLAKTIVPWPLYYLVHTQWIVTLAKNYYRHKNSSKFPIKSDDESWEKIYHERRKKKRQTDFHYSLKSKPYLYIPYKLIIFIVSLIAFFYTVEFLAYILGLDNDINRFLSKTKIWLSTYYLYFELPVFWKIIWVTYVIIFINWSRRFLWFALKSLFPIFNKIISPKGVELLERYLLMGRFSLYNSQQQVAQRALFQLPHNSKMVILPMDMEEMGAGKTKMTKNMLNSKAENLKETKLKKDIDGWTEYDYSDTYKYQMRELWEFVKTNRISKAKKNESASYYPFLFLDPRRMAKEKTAFFDYEIVNDRMKLKDCFVKTYMEDRNFSGFKIYPALGYYVFDELLLPVWRYASENNIPIMTHCVIGVIYYRGKKKKTWNYHPVFKQYYADRTKPENESQPMLLPQTKNVDIQFNFTHPLNYLCLLEEQLFKEVLKTIKDDEIKNLFGYKDDNTPLSYNLSNLKICLAHYGGEEEWIKFLETDRDVYSRRIIKNPDEGILFMKNNNNQFSHDKINSLWHDTDWYSIITSMLMQYTNFYADLSYIISKPSIYPLLKQTLQKGKNYKKQHLNYLAESSPNKKASHLKGRNRLRSHILYGTDFYVVRNHNSDKDLYTEAKAVLDEETFDLIARENTHNYLSRH